MALSFPRALAAGFLVTAAVGVAVPASATVPIYPGVTSDNVTFLANFPDTLMISAEFALTGNFFYTSSLDTIAAFSYEIVGDTVEITLEGTLVDAKFENESMTYGERRDASGAVTDRFVVVAEDLFHVDPTAAADTHVGGDNVVIIDVTDPTALAFRSQAEIATSTHTVQCLSRRSCDYAYSVGGSGMFSIIDMRDLDAPVQVSPTGGGISEDTFNALSPAAAPNDVFARGAGHYWDVDDAGIAWQTGSGGAAAFDISDPTAPVILNATDETGTQSPFNDFILHNSMRPNATAFDADRADGNDPSLAKGNVLLVTEEDYANEGDEVDCTLAGEFSTWAIPSLDNATYLAGTDEPYLRDGGSITHLDSIHPVRDGFGSPTSAPGDAFCSAHWFDYHETGIVAEGFYSAGLYFIDVRDPADLGVYGYATARPSQVWDAYWFPERDANGVDTGRNTSFVMTADAVRGVDVFRVDLPAEVIEAAAPGTAGGDTGTTQDAVDPDPVTSAPDDQVASEGLAATGGGPLLLALASLAVATVLLPRRRRA